jgi:hypothetical protein
MGSEPFFRQTGTINSPIQEKKGSDPILQRWVRSGGEEIDRLGGGDRFYVSRFEAEHPDTLYEFTLEIFVTEFTGYDLAERNLPRGCDRQPQN